MIETLCNFFRSVIALTPNELLPCVYLCLNKLAPAYEGVELGIGETLLMKAIAQCTGNLISRGGWLGSTHHVILPYVTRLQLCHYSDVTRGRYYLPGPLTIVG